MVFVFHGLVMFVQWSSGWCWVATELRSPSARFYMCCQCVYISGMVSTCCLHLATCHARYGGLYQFCYCIYTVLHIFRQEFFWGWTRVIIKILVWIWAEFCFQLKSTLCCISLGRCCLGLEIRTIIKISTHPCYPINLDWFSLGWRIFFLQKEIKNGRLKKTTFFKIANSQYFL